MRKIRTKLAVFMLAFSLVVPVGAALSAETYTVEAKTKKVYIAASGRGKCYHSSKNCSRMRGRVKKIKLSKAKKLHYRACSKCYR